MKFFFFLLAIICFYRSPYIFTNGRFFSLDLKYHLLFLDLNFFEAITYVDFTARYINLISNISAIISSRFFDLVNAQFVAVYLSFFILLIIFYLILSKNSYLFKQNYQKYLGAIICLVAPVLSFEIWLNAINIQVYLGIIAIIILFLKEEKIRILNVTLIFIAGLSGVYACLLTPFFFFKYILRKNISDLINFIVLLICCIIQLYLIFYISTDVISLESQASSNNTSLQFKSNKFEVISFFYNVVVRAFFGSTIPKFIASGFDINIINLVKDEYIKNLLFKLSISLFIILILLTIFFYFLLKKENKIIYVSLLIIFVLVSFTVIFGGDTYSLHGRYSSVPGIILIFIFLHISASINIKSIKFLTIFLLISTVFFGLLDFRLKKYIYYFDCINCPDWNSEVESYRNDKNYNLNSWPYHIDR